MSFSCVKHPMTMAHHICGECGHQFCPECVVFPFGAAKPPMCIACALEMGGLRRQNTGRPKLTRRSIRQRLAMQRRISSSTGAQTTLPERDPEREWMEGSAGPQDVPGGWSQHYPS